MKHRPLCSTDECGNRAAFRIRMEGNVVLFACHACRGYALRAGIADARIIELPH